MSGPLLCNLQYTIRIMHPNVEELVQLDFQTGPRYYRNKQLSKHKYWSESEKMTIQQYLKLFKQLSFLLNTSRTKFGFLIQQRSTCIHRLVAFAEKIYIYIYPLMFTYNKTHKRPLQSIWQIQENHLLSETRPASSVAS